MGFYFSQTSVICFCRGLIFSYCPYYRGVRYRRGIRYRRGVHKTRVDCIRRFRKNSTKYVQIQGKTNAVSTLSMTDSFLYQHNPAWYEHNGLELKQTHRTSYRSGTLVYQILILNLDISVLMLFFGSIRRSESLLRFQYLITLPQNVAENRPICDNPLSRSAQRSFSLLQKPPVVIWFLYRCKRYPV